MNITIKNVPLKLYRDLKQQAKKNRRTLSEEVLERLWIRVLCKSQEQAEAVFAWVQKLRNQQPPVHLSIEEIKAAINEGRIDYAL